MDRLGIGILRELLVDESTLTLQADARRPYRDIAKRLHVTEDTVRNRVQKMGETGLIRGWRLGINPTLFDYQTEFVLVDVNPPSTKEEVIKVARRISRVIAMQNFFDNTVGISLAYASRKDFNREIVRLRRAANSRNVFTVKTPFQRCKLKLTETDWDIVKAIHRDPRRAYGKIAKELGLARRTVKRRAGRMLLGHAFFVLPELDLRNLDGVLANLSVIYPTGLKSEIDRQIFEKYGDMLAIGHSTQVEYSWFAFIVPNLGVAKEIQTWAGNLKGVTMAHVAVSEEVVYPLGDAFGRELQKMPLVMAEARTGMT